MNQKEISDKIESAKQLLNEIAPYVKEQAVDNPDNVNAVVLMTAAHDGQETVLNGVTFGDHASILATIVNSLSAQPNLVPVFRMALAEHDRRENCDCEVCSARRAGKALENQLKNNQN